MPSKQQSRSLSVLVGSMHLDLCLSLSVSMLVSKVGLLCMFCGEGMNDSPFLSNEVSTGVSLKLEILVNLLGVLLVG